MDASTPDRMVIRRTTPHGDRRRRVVVKEPDASAEGRPAGDENAAPAMVPRRYAAAALREAQPHTCDWIPTRLRSLAAWFAGLSALVAMAGGLHLLALEAARRWQIELPALRLDTDRNVAHLVHATLWLLTALCCRQTLRFRRHRVDDYRGRYRVWYPVTAIALLLGVNSVAGITQNLMLAAPRLQSLLGLPASASWSILPLLALATLVSSRIAAEIWACRPAVVTLGLACGLTWTLGALQLFNGLPAEAPARTLTASLGVLATAQLFLFSMLLNLRHTYLDAQGELPLRETKPREDSASRETPTAVATETAAAPRAAGPKSAGPSTPPVLRPPVADEPRGGQDLDGESDEADETDEAEVDEYGQTVSMSRAERKRLRKMQQKQKRAA